MKTLYATMAAGLALGGAAIAQEDHTVIFDKMAPQLRVMSLQGGIMGKPVKGAPYSGMEISENSQVLADGTRIHNETQTQVYRDSEGRVRRESGNEISIWDPVANLTWLLNTKTQTARKLPISTVVYSGEKGTTTETRTFVVGGGVVGAVGRMRRDEETKVVETRAAEVRNAEAKMKAEIETKIRMAGTPGVMVPPPPGSGDLIQYSTIRRMKGNTESLGKRTIEGVSADGTRMVSTIEAGAIGNDRPIQSVTERWFSPDLQTLMLSRSTDPRTGEESFKLVNVSRAEPAAYLFQVPAGYQINEMK